MDKSVQQLMDERMCRPGYRWNSTLKRCLAEGAGAGEVKSPEESIAAGVAATVLNLKQERSQLCSYGLSAARFSIGEVPVAPVAPIARTVTRTSQTMRRILITMRGESCCA